MRDFQNGSRIPLKLLRRTVRAERLFKRICSAFEKVVSELVASGETSAVVITHGGVIMNLLSVYGLPHAKPYDWQMDSGFGYSLRINTLLWQRDKVCEVYALAPYKSRGTRMKINF